MKFYKQIKLLTSCKLPHHHHYLYFHRHILRFRPNLVWNWSSLISKGNMLVLINLNRKGLAKFQKELVRIEIEPESDENTSNEDECKSDWESQIFDKKVIKIWISVTSKTISSFPTKNIIKLKDKIKLYFLYMTLVVIFHLNPFFNSINSPSFIMICIL